MTTTPPWILVTAEQLKKGWIEMKGVTPVHHDFIVIKDYGGGTFKVRNPELQLMEDK